MSKRSKISNGVYAVSTLAGTIIGVGLFSYLTLLQERESG